MSQTDELSRVKARIKALTEKTIANGCTEAEAMAAAEMVGRLLERYALSMDAIEIRTARCVQVAVPIGGRRRRPIDGCVPAIARFCDCKVWLARAAAPDPMHRRPLQRSPAATMCFSASRPIPPSPPICSRSSIGRSAPRPPPSGSSIRVCRGCACGGPRRASSMAWWPGYPTAWTPCMRPGRDRARTTFDRHRFNRGQKPCGRRGIRQRSISGWCGWPRPVGG